MNTHRRIGVVVPATNTVVEEDVFRIAACYAGPSPSFHVARAGYNVPFETSPSGFLDSLLSGLGPAAQSLRTLDIVSCGFFCTSASAATPEPSATQVPDRALSEASRLLGCPVHSPITALCDAARVAGIASLAVFTPYVHSLGARVCRAIETAGLVVTAQEHAGYTTAFEDVPTDVILHAMSHHSFSSSEAVFVSCTNLHTVDAIVELERLSGKYVLSSNTVLLWRLAAALWQGHVPGRPVPRVFALPPPSSA